LKNKQYCLSTFDDPKLDNVIGQVGVTVESSNSADDSVHKPERVLDDSEDPWISQPGS